MTRDAKTFSMLCMVNVLLAKEWLRSKKKARRKYKELIGGLEPQWKNHYKIG